MDLIEPIVTSLPSPFEDNFIDARLDSPSKPGLNQDYFQHKPNHAPVFGQKNVSTETITPSDDDSDDTKSLQLINSQLSPIDKASFIPDNTNYNFLLVDDNVINLRILARILHKLYPKASITQVQDSTKVIPLVRVNKYDIIFLDIEMPEINGVEIAQIIRKQDEWTSLGLIAVTTKCCYNEMKKYSEVGIDVTLAKPLNYSHNYMMNCIDRVIRTRSF